MNGGCSFDTFTRLGYFQPVLLYVLEHHVAVTIKGFDLSEQLSIVSAVDQNLGICLDALGEYRKRTGIELLILEFVSLQIEEQAHKVSAGMTRVCQKEAEASSLLLGILCNCLHIYMIRPTTWHTSPVIPESETQ